MSPGGFSEARALVFFSMPYIGPLNTSGRARKSDFDFDLLSQHPAYMAGVAKINFGPMTEHEA